MVIANARKGLSAKDAVENIEATQTDEIEDSGDHNTIISEDNVTSRRESEGNWEGDKPKAVTRYNHLSHTCSWTPCISRGISMWAREGGKGLTDMQEVCLQ